MIVLDTDVLTIIQERSGREYHELAGRLDVADDDVYTTIVSFEEQVRGWLARISRAQTPERQIVAYGRLQRLLEDYRSRPLLSFDEQASHRFKALRHSRIRIGTMDLRIASIALANNALLISRNLSDFDRVPDLRVEDWTFTA